MSDRFHNSPDEPLSCWAVPNADVVEIPLLLPGWQAQALEEAAHHRGLTAAEMVRGLLREFIKQQKPAAEPEPVLARQSD